MTHNQETIVGRIAAILRANGEAVPANLGAMLESSDGSDLAAERMRWLMCLDQDAAIALGKELLRIGGIVAEMLKRQMGGKDR
jgi:hypothetical protein